MNKTIQTCYICVIEMQWSAADDFILYAVTKTWYFTLMALLVNVLLGNSKAINVFSLLKPLMQIFLFSVGGEERFCNLEETRPDLTAACGSNKSYHISQPTRKPGMFSYATVVLTTVICFAFFFASSFPNIRDMQANVLYCSVRLMKVVMLLPVFPSRWLQL